MPTGALATLVTAPNEFGRPWIAPPNMPAGANQNTARRLDQDDERSRILSEAKKRGWPVEAVGGEELAELAKEVIAQPPEVIARLKKLLAE